MLTPWDIKTGGCRSYASGQGGRKKLKKKILKVTKISDQVLPGVEGSKLLSLKPLSHPGNGHQVKLHNRVLGQLSYACIMFPRSLSSILARHCFQATLSDTDFKQSATTINKIIQLITAC